MFPLAQMGWETVGHGLGVFMILPLVHVAIVQLLTFQDSPFWMGIEKQ